MDFNETKNCPLCDRTGCYIQGHHYGHSMNHYDCSNCGKFNLDDGILGLTTVFQNGKRQETRDTKPCNAVYSFLLQHPCFANEQAIWSFTMTGEIVNSHSIDANISVSNLLEKYPHEDDEYKKYCILKNLYKKFGKNKFTTHNTDFALFFCESNNAENDRNFWIKTLTKAGYLDLDMNQNYMTPQERTMFQGMPEYNVSLNGITFLNSKKIEFECSDVPKVIDKDKKEEAISTLKAGVDVFISHASEDKSEIAEPLAKLLIERGITVFYDKISIDWGDSIPAKIDTGLANCKMALIIISPNFIKKQWTKKELDALQMLDESKLLPLWHSISKKEVQGFSPTLAARKALTTADYTTEDIAEKIAMMVSRTTANGSSAEKAGKQKVVETADEKRRKAEIAERARAFIIDHDEERGYLPLCAIAASVNGLRKHKRAIYNDFNKCPTEVQNEILRQADYCFKVIEGNKWVDECVAELEKYIKAHKLSNRSDAYLYNGAKYLHRGFDNHGNQEIGNSILRVPLDDGTTVLVGTYISNYIDFNIENDVRKALYKIPPFNLILDPLANANEDIFCLWMMELVADTCADAFNVERDCSDYKLGWNDVSGDAYEERYEDKYYHTLQCLYLAFSKQNRKNKMLDKNQVIQS